MTEKKTQKKKKKQPGRPKGLPKTGGRQKGTPNKNRLMLKEEFESKGFDFVDEILKLYKDPDCQIGYKMMIIEKLLPYVLPKLKDIDPVSGLTVRDNYHQFNTLIQAQPSSRLTDLLTQTVLEVQPEDERSEEEERSDEE